MNVQQFVKSRRSAWRKFSKRLDEMERLPVRRRSPEELAEFSREFRAVCHDLALVRSRDWGRGLVQYLNNLATHAHNVFYRAPPGNARLVVRYLVAGFPRLFRRNIGYFCVAAALFFVPLAITWAVVQADPSTSARVLDSDVRESFEEMYSRDARENQENDEDFGEQRATAAGFYVWNNVGIAFRCFSLGVLAGVGTVYVLVFNGIVIGATAGAVIAAGHGDRFLSFVVSHGSFELTAIAVAGGAGLMLADAIFRPGQKSNAESLQSLGFEAIQIAMGAGCMLVIAALIEAFWSPAPIAPELKYSVGGGLWILVALYLGLSGRTDGSGA